MKKQFVLFAACIVLGLSSLMAQENRQRQTPAEKAKATVEKMVALELDAETKLKTESIFTEFYDAQHKSMKEMRAARNTDRNAMMAERKRLADERDAKLKAIFTEEQYRKWISDVEPSLRQQQTLKAPVAN